MSNTKQHYDYTLEPWSVTEEAFSVAKNYHHETVFAVGNGYIGMRGNFEEGYNGPADTTLLGTYLNGFYESAPIHYDELAYGFAANKQTILNVANSKVIRLYIEGEEFSLFSGKIIKYQRRLDLKTGMMHRDITWESPQRKRVQINIQRLVPLEHKHLAVINYQVTPLNFSGEIKLVSAIDGDVGNQKSVDDSRVGSALSGKILQLVDKQVCADYCTLTQIAPTTKFMVVCGMQNIVAGAEYTKNSADGGEMVSDTFAIQAQKNQQISLTKYISYFTSKDYQKAELLDLTGKELRRAKTSGFAEILAAQVAYLESFYQGCDVEIEGDLALQQGLRFNQLHLLMSVGKDGKTSIAAKGVTGEGYEGHYFWDSDTYVLPFFLYTKPEIAKKLLQYRYSALPVARARAQELDHKGALYAWRTIDGEECSSYYPAGTAAYHINADIILALKLYFEATNDIEFMLNFGAEMAFATARFWADIGCYVPKNDNKFCINCVTGPDEYTAIVDNNFYTNIMAQMNLQFAYDIAMMLQKKHKNDFAQLAAKLQIQKQELAEWKRAADNMYLPYDEELGINPQDDTFLTKEPWDFAGTPKENYPIYHHYHYLNIYRYQVLKQADVILANFWFGDHFSLEAKKRNYDYYEPLTTHDSSLSLCTHSIMAAEIDYSEQAYEYFIRTARLDLDNIHDGSQHGIHAANMAGTWMCITYGFAGMRVYNGQLSFAPKLPEAWQRCGFKLRFRGRLLAVTITATGTSYELIDGEPLSIYHNGQLQNLA